MKLIQSILVAYDFSDPSKEALKRAITLAQSFDAKLSIVHVNDHQLATIYGMPIGKEAEQKLQSKIEEDIKEINSSAKIHSIDVFTGYPYFFIIAKAQTLPADLVIVGSHGRTGFRRILLGSVAEKVARLSPVPVLINRNHVTKNEKKILIPIDHSQASEEAISYAQLYASHANSKIQLVHVVEISSFASELHYAGILNENTQKQEERMEQLSKKYGVGLPPLVLQGSVSATIAEACENDPNIELIIMSTHGHSGIKHFLMGSRAESIVRHAPCSVLTIRPDAIKSELHKRIEEDVKKAHQYMQ